MSISVITLALAALHSASDVTLELQPSTLSSAMATLSKAAGKGLNLSSLLANEVVYVSVKNVDSDEFLKKLADTVGGQWVSTSSGLTLNLDTDSARNDSNLALTERTQKIKQEIEKLVAQLKSTQAITPTEIQKQMESARQQMQNGVDPAAMRQNMEGMQIRLPGTRTIFTVLGMMRAEDLARIEHGQRVVFSSSPTPMQKPLPSSASSLMADFVKNQSIFGGIQGRPGGRRGGPENASNQAAQAQTTPPPVPSKAYLIATRQGQTLNFTYIVASSKGQNLGSANYSLTIENSAPQGSASTQGGDTLNLSSESKADLAFLGSGNRFGGGFQRMGGAMDFGNPGGRPGGFGPGGGRAGRGGEGDYKGLLMSIAPQEQPIRAPQTARATAGFSSQAQQASPELAKKLSDPVTNEPINLALGEVYHAISEKTGKNVIALIPDAEIAQVSGYLRANHSVNEFIETAKSQWNLSITSEESWLLIRPKDRTEARASRFDRASLKEFLDTVQKKGSARLNDIAKYASKSPNGIPTGLDMQIVRAVIPDSTAIVGQIYANNREMFQILGTMSLATKQNLDSGKVLSVTGLSASAYGLLNKMVFNSFDGSQLVQATNVNQFPMPQGNQRMGRGNPFGGLFDMTAERTEILPSGTPNSSVVVMQSNSQLIVKATANDGKVSRNYTPESMAMEKLSRENTSNFAGPQPTIVNWDTYAPGTRSQYTFIFTLANGITITRSLDDNSFDESQASKQLPDEFAKAVTASYDQFKERFAQRQEGNPNADQNATGRFGRRGGGQNGTKPPLN